ncbi:Yos9p CYBJADRAFT_173590 [Cyberlindnera jadinii NRRL Y-1542]|uniref:Endoplasmic reticulum lectin n=1 Tax=Cyberlindnera jadinii (strain ATCC 18201 / CBS 1600 / BCRC 20928 / JCM 3617 / NBRC 0987 / NRRL Y-1542) TaxID=983966 RepID=A0A1E4S0R7_CYBJN|nr:hypothetical protein CYBJADRAFT_173590 [Cyberlindnera jadinii NRRL Y-1542]ODV73079.1 hypothetical protein CYBJADRAFT_173590 [Cyberlindnera jadinii NRRL Y-1542]
MKLGSSIVLATLVAVVSAVFNLFDDEFSSPKYVFKTAPDINAQWAETLLSASYPNDTYYRLHTHDDVYVCHVPSPLDDDESGPGDANEDDDSLHSQELRLQGYSELIKSILQPHACYFFPLGYWTYSYCPSTEFGQFNGDPMQYINNRDKLNVFVLGTTPRFNETWSLLQKREAGRTVLSYTMENGAICDVTGKPRTVEVQFMCNPDSKVPELMSVREYRTCHYLAQIGMSKLCDDPILSVKGDANNQITCQRVSNGEEQLVSPYRIGITEDYQLSRFSSDIFIATHHETGMVELVTLKDDNSDLIERIGSRFFQVMVGSKPNVKDYANGFNFQSHVYNTHGEFQTSVLCQCRVVDGEPRLVIKLNPQYLSFENSWQLEGLESIDQHESHFKQGSAQKEQLADTIRQLDIEVEIPDDQDMEKVIFDVVSKLLREELGEQGRNPDQALQIDNQETEEEQVETGSNEDANNVIHDEL